MEPISNILPISWKHSILSVMLLEINSLISSGISFTRSCLMLCGITDDTEGVGDEVAVGG
jgi:hypothetical protein